MKKIIVDINCDVGEGVGNEIDLLPLISSCNIACGGHAGDKKSMADVIRLAMNNQVKIGAHPSYPDKENFGRVVMNISSRELILSLNEQLSIFVKILEQQKGVLNHIKPHGALYNKIAEDENLANIFLDAIENYKNIPIYLPYQSQIHQLAIKRGFKFHLEAFADRNYTSSLKLVSRSLENAVIHEPKLVLQHLVKMIREEAVDTIEGLSRKIKAHTFCVHGDTPTALQILMYLSQELPKNQIEISK